MPELSERMGKVVTRRRVGVHGSLRTASDRSDLSVGTWQRIEKGESFEYPSLVKAVVSLAWPGSAADDLLDDVDPDEPKPEGDGQRSDTLAGLNGKLDQATPEELAMLEAYLDGLFARRAKES